MTQPLDFSMRLTADGGVAVREAGKAEEAIKNVGGAAAALNRQSADTEQANNRLIETWARYAATLGKSKSEVMDLEAKVSGMNAAQLESVRSIQQVIQAHDNAEAASRSLAESQATAARQSASFVTTLGNVGKAIAVALAGVYAISIKNAQEAEQASLRLDAVLRATGEQANVSRAQIDGYAEALAATTKFDDEALRRAAGTLLTFQNVGASSFERVLKAGTDLAAFMNSDLDSAIRLVGKAMEDPAQGATALRRAGIMLSDSQLELAKSAVAAGDSLTAQRVILEALESRIGGVAQTMHTGLAQTTSETAKAFAELTESIGKTSLVSGSYAFVLGGITKAMQQLKALVDDGKVSFALRLLAGHAGAAAAAGDLQTAGAAPDPDQSAAESARLAAFAQNEAAAAENAANAYNMKWKAIDGAREAFAKMAAQYADKDAKFAATAAEIRAVGQAAGLSAAQIEAVVAAADQATFGAQREAAARKDAAEKSRVFRDALREMQEEAKAEAAERAKARKELEDYEKVLKRTSEQAMKRFTAELEKSAEQLEAEAARQKRANDEFELGVGVVQDLTTAKLAAAVAAKELAGEYDKEYDSLVRQLAASRDLANELRRGAGLKATSDAAKEASRDWLRTAEGIRDDLTDAFMTAAASGRNFFKSLAADLQRMFSQLVLRPIVQAVMAPVAGALTSALGYSGGAYGATGGGGGGLGGSLGQNMAGNYLQNSYLQGGTWNSALAGTYASTFGASSFTAAAAGDAFMPAALGAYGAETAGVGALAGEAMASLAAAAPYIAAFVAIAYMAYQAFGQEPGGPKAGGYAFSGTGMTPWNRKDQFTDGGFQPGHFTPNTMDSVLQPIVNDWTKGLAATVKAFGGAANAQSAFDLGIDRDPAGTAANRLGIRASVNGKQVYNYWSGDDALGRDDQALQDALQLESKRALLAALQASALPEQIGAVFDTLLASAATSAEIDNLMAFGSAMKSIIDSIGGSVVDDAAQAWEDMQRNTVEVLRDMGSEVSQLAADMDGSTASMQALAGATAAYRQAAAQALVAIEQVRYSLANSFTSIREQLEFAGLDQQGTYDLLRSKAEDLTALLAGAGDASQVKSYTDRINAYFTQAFGMLDPTAQLAMKQAFLDDLAVVEEAANARLNELKDQINSDTADPFAAANQALSDAAGKFNSAAVTQESAAAMMARAAETMTAAADKIDGAQFTVNVVYPSPVGGG